MHRPAQFAASVVKLVKKQMPIENHSPWSAAERGAIPYSQTVALRTWHQRAISQHGAGDNLFMSLNS
jgi:hypothetical protein